MTHRNALLGLLRCAPLAFVLMLAACGEAGRADVAAMEGDPVRGRLALSQYACQACHTIPGVTGSDVHVGPPLARFAGRRHIARGLPNTPENLARWIRDPKGVDPHTAMPMLGVSEADAKDMTAYLFLHTAGNR
ncbi:MAG: c-type cytochrome [Noviherbaspirillum sp.]